ncbi:hypothetical protein CRG98_007507 [Punica granatum]|uniref:Uncharacterized protein n=1 Tax=Punica granatum TaxID=22663 RepID=A0A2I0KUW6_PUNGR|nr:hypothetical protein CRG98_007507 [Punica granatum]
MPLFDPSRCLSTLPLYSVSFQPSNLSPSAVRFEYYSFLRPATSYRLSVLLFLSLLRLPRATAAIAWASNTSLSSFNRSWVITLLPRPSRCFCPVLLFLLAFLTFRAPQSQLPVTPLLLELQLLLTTFRLPFIGFPELLR